MPIHEPHCQDSLRKYGKRFDNMHTWMDEPCEILGKKHRMYRHDPYTTPQEAKRLFGIDAHHACLDHIILDRRYTAELRRSPSSPYVKLFSSGGTGPQNGATPIQPTPGPDAKTDRGSMEIPSRKEMDSLETVRGKFRELAEVMSESYRMFPKKSEIPQKTSPDSLGAKAQTLFNLFILLKTIKYVIPG